jgi:hypothetical protein
MSNTAIFRLIAATAFAGLGGCSYLIEIFGNFDDGRSLKGAIYNGGFVFDTPDGTSCGGFMNFRLASGGGELSCKDGRRGSFEFRSDSVSFPHFGVPGHGSGTGEIEGKKFQFRAGPLSKKDE